MSAANKKILRLTLDLDFELLALTSSLRDYRLCHMLNTRAGFNFKKDADYVLHLNQNSGPTYFSRFLDYREASENELYLLANKGSEGFLIPEMNRVDFFILIKGYMDEQDLQMMLGSMNQIPEVQAVLKVDPARVKSKENLIF